MHVVAAIVVAQVMAHAQFVLVANLQQPGDAGIEERAIRLV